MTARAELDPAYAPILGALAQLPPLSAMSLAEARGLWKTMDFGPLPAIASMRDLTIPGSAAAIPARLYLPCNQPAALIVFFHGGGWTLGDLDTHDPAARDLANDSLCAVLSIDYRLAPEHPYPAALQDCLAALQWAGANRATLGCGGRKLAVAGDSAGGNLAAAVALANHRQGGVEVARQVLIYPVTDGSMQGESYREHATDGLLSAADMVWFWDNYVPEASGRADPLAAPLRAPSLAGLPPAIVAVAEFDPLRDDGLAYAGRLAKDDVTVELLRYDTQTHGFFTFGAAVPSARAASREIAAFIHKALAG